ncbi:MAG: phosphoenolpyruvate carboxykinase (ATP) [Bacteroidales bacterium]
MNSHPLKSKIDLLLKAKDHVLRNLRQEKIIRYVVDNEEAIVSRQGALATWTSRESTGRRPKDTVIVRKHENKEMIDWDSPNNIPPQI